MDELLISIFKKVVNCDGTVKSDVIDYIANNAEGKNKIPVRIDGKRCFIPEKEYNSMAGICRTGIDTNWESKLKIPMIKAFREITGCGLKDANEAVSNRDNWVS